MGSVINVPKSKIELFLDNGRSIIVFSLLVGLATGGLIFLILKLLPHLAPLLKVLQLDPLFQALCYACTGKESALPLAGGGTAAAVTIGGTVLKGNPPETFERGDLRRQAAKEYGQAHEAGAGPGQQEATFNLGKKVGDLFEKASEELAGKESPGKEPTGPPSKPRLKDFPEK